MLIILLPKEVYFCPEKSYNIDVLRESPMRGRNIRLTEEDSL